MADLLQDLSEEVEQATEFPQILDDAGRSEEEFIDPVREAAEPAIVPLYAELDLPLLTEQRADAFVGEALPYATGRVALDDEILVETGITDLDVLRTEGRLEPAEDMGPVDLERESFRVHIGGTK